MTVDKKKQPISKEFLLISFWLSILIFAKDLYAEPVTFKYIAVNPSKTKSQKTTLKEYLPVEVKPKSIIDLAGLDLEYDSQKCIYYLYKKNLELMPAEIKVFEVSVEDVWLIPQKDIDNLKERVNSILGHLENTEYFPKAQEMADTVNVNLNDIIKTQTDETISRDRHIGAYRENVDTMKRIKEMIEEMERMLVTAGGPPAPDMLENAKVVSDSPSKNMTWIVIFIIMVFLALLAAVLFFTWQYQARLTKDALSDSRRAAFPGGEEKPKE